MCAPTKDLAKIALIAGAAYATGGLSLGGTTAATATTAATTAGTAATTGASAFNWSGMFQTLSSVAKVATPVLGAVGSIYSGYLNANILKSKANYVDYSIFTTTEAAALRKVKRQREMRQALASQYAKYGLTGVTLEGTPTDVLSETSAKFAQDQFYDDYNTSLDIQSKRISAGQLRQEAQSAQLTGFVNAATTLGVRGFPTSKKTLLSTNVVNSEANQLAGIRTGTEGSF